MTSIPDKIRSALIDQTVNVHRFEAGRRLDIRRMLDQLGKDLVADILDAGLDTKRTDWQRARLHALVRQAEAKITETYGLIDSTMADQMKGLIEIGSSGITTAINDAIGARLLAPINWTPEMLSKLAGDTLIQGAPSAEWWSRQGKDMAQAFADQMRQGLLRGETVGQLRDRVLGSGISGVGSAGKVDLRGVAPRSRSLIQASRRNAESLVRTSVISTANAAHLEVYRANRDIVEGLAWCSTLDNRTTQICRALDGLNWDLDGNPIGHSHPFPGSTAHWGCRSIQIPVTKSWEALAAEAGGDTRLARELDKIPVKQRASMNGPVSSDLTYEKWFAQQTEKRQKEILGPGKLDLWKDGKLGFTDMIDQRTNPLSLDEIRAGLGDPRAKSPNLVSALEAIETKTRYNKRESAHLFTPEGVSIVSKKGGESSVGFTMDELKHFPGNILTHNHPRGSSFSPQDIRLACKFKLSEIRASGSVARYSMAPPDGGWDASFWNNRVAPLLKRVEQDVHDEFTVLIRKGEMDFDQANLRHFHEVWTRISKELHLNYKREEWA